MKFASASVAAAVVAVVLAGCGGGSSGTSGPAVPATPSSTAPASDPVAARLPAGDTSVAVTFDRDLLAAVRDTRPPAPVVARALAVTHTAEYDAWAAYDPVAVSTRRAVTRRPPAERSVANQNVAVTYAAYRALVDLFPSERALFDARMSALGLDTTVTTTDPSTAAGVGNAAAAAVIAFRHNDGSNQLGGYADTTGYVAVNTPTQLNDPSRWQPLLVTDVHGVTAAQSFSLPQWGGVTPFALTNGSQFRPPPPPAFGSAQYRAGVDEVVTMSAQLGDREKAIAEYWMDGPNSELPPGHWCLFGDYVAQRDHHVLADDVKMLFAVSNAVLDAGIGAWDAKRFYDAARPVSAIHAIYGGKTIQAWAGPNKGTAAIDGASWQPYQPSYVITPPFPEYVSGHSAFSAAAAEVLRSYTGSDAFGFTNTVLPGTSKVEPGATPATPQTFTYATFSDAADAAGISRRYGGIHFVWGDLAGRSLGRAVGAVVWAKAQSYFNGTAP